MAVVGTDLASVSVVIDIFSYEDRRKVARSERLELFEHPEEFRGNLLEFKERVNMYYWSKYLLGNLLLYITLKAVYENLQILLLKCQAGSLGVASEIFKKVGALFNCLVQVKSGNTPRRACYKAIGVCKYNGRTVVGLHKAACHNAHNAFVP